MKILLVHNGYIERGGEDEVVRSQQAMLEENGHQVRVYQRSNKEIDGYALGKKINFFLKDICWNTSVYEGIKRIIDEFRPEIVHIHNIFYVVSPSVYQACSDKNVPVVQSFHNYRLLLSKKNADEFPEFAVPSKKLKKYVLRHCLLPRILERLRRERSYEDKVESIILQSRFSEKIFLKHGFNSSKIRVMSPMLEIAAPPAGEARANALFAGRLVDYKGIHVLLKAAERASEVRLRIVGDGPLRDFVSQESKRLGRVQYVGALSHDKLI